MTNARTAVLALLATSLLAAGCGSDDKDSSSTSTPAASTATTAASTDITATETTATETTSTPSTSVPATADAAVKAGIESCKQSIAAQPTISDDVKQKLDKVCEKITDEEGAKAAIKDVCTTIINESQIPDGAAKDQALAACDAAQ